MSKPTIDRMQSVEPTPEELARCFCEMGSDEQARFFNACHERTEGWFPMQLQAITEDDGLTLQGRMVMQAIGGYSHWGLACKAIPKLSP